MQCSGVAKKAYQAPQLEVLGTAKELTQIGFTNAGADGVYHDKLGYEGSVDNPGGPKDGTVG